MRRVLELGSFVYFPDQADAQHEGDEVPEETEQRNLHDLRRHIRRADRAGSEEQRCAEHSKNDLVDHLVHAVQRLLRAREVEVDLRLAAHRHLEDVRDLFRQLCGLAHEQEALALDLVHLIVPAEVLLEVEGEALREDLDEADLRAAETHNTLDRQDTAREHREPLRAGDAVDAQDIHDLARQDAHLQRLEVE